MSNFTRVIKLLLLVSCICAGAFNAGAQCNSEFGYVMQQAQRQVNVTFDAVVQEAGKNHQWYSNGAFIGSGPVVTYPYYQPGQYRVTHIMYDSVHSCLDSTTKNVDISFGISCYADFYTNTNDSAVLGSAVLYANPAVYGSAITNYLWSINGTVVDSSNSTTYTLTQPGRDYTCLTITTDSGCSSQLCKWVQVYSKCNLSASYSYTLDSLNPATVTFYPGPASSNFTYKWKINYWDNYNKTPAVQSGSGTYPVSLYVFDTVHNCFDSTAGTFTVPPFACDTFNLSFMHDFAPGDSSIIYFRAQSNQPLTSQSWIIRSLYDSSTYINVSTPDPFYNFTDTGHYLVCVTAQSAAGCAGSYCDIVYAGSKYGKPANNAVTSYPNPAVGEVSFTMPLAAAGKLTINVYNANGLRVYSLQKQGISGNNQIKIPVHQLQPGQYFIEIISGNERKRSVFQKL